MKHSSAWTVHKINTFSCAFLSSVYSSDPIENRQIIKLTLVSMMHISIVIVSYFNFYEIHKWKASWRWYVWKSLWLKQNSWWYCWRRAHVLVLFPLFSNYQVCYTSKGVIRQRISNSSKYVISASRVRILYVVIEKYTKIFGSISDSEI